MGSKVRSNWRKSSQWIALTRRHAQGIVADSEFYPKFQSYCRAAYDNDYKRYTPLNLSIACCQDWYRTIEEAAWPTVLRWLQVSRLLQASAQTPKVGPSSLLLWRDGRKSCYVVQCAAAEVSWLRVC